MGVDTGLVVYATDEAQARRACEAAFERLAVLEDHFSDYRPTSELMQLCGKAGGPPVPVSDELFRVLAFGQQVAARSGGAFDMTVGPLVQLWRHSRTTGRLPSPAAVTEAKALVGHEKVILDPREKTVRLTTAGMRLDLGGIAKGYAGDEALRVLRRHGITSALYQAGGDIVLGDAPPGTVGWQVEIPHGSTPTTSPSTKLTLANCAVSTSGDTNQFVDIEGVRYSHLLNPRTGLGLTSRKLVTVIAPDGLTSDPLSKAASLLPADDLDRLLQHYPEVKVYARSVPL